MELTKEQKDLLAKYFEEYKQEPTVVNEGQTVPFADFDKARIDATGLLRELVLGFLGGTISLEDFKLTSSEYALKKYPYWGFKGFSGQMQLNQYVNNIADSRKDEELKKAIRIPADKDEAKAKINEFAQYLSGLKTQAENPKSIPRINQSFLLSYFWSMQEGIELPIFYGSYRKQLLSMGFLLDVAETPGDEYVMIVDIFDSLKRYFSEELGVKGENMLWFIEHVLWKQFTKADTEEASEGATAVRAPAVERREETNAPNSWIPPIVADLEELALNKESTWSVARGVRPEKAFETKLRYAYTLLGFQVTELGQGTGREPDGVAISNQTPDGYYALVYDAKARESAFSIGTSDREIVEYIRKKQQELGRQRVSKLSFVIVSSEFVYNATMKETLMSVFRATRVPVILLRAADLLFIIEEKLKNGDIDHARLENLFLETGLLTREKILSELGG